MHEMQTNNLSQPFCNPTQDEGSSSNTPLLISPRTPCSSKTTTDASEDPFDTITTKLSVGSLTQLSDRFVVRKSEKDGRMIASWKAERSFGGRLHPTMEHHSTRTCGGDPESIHCKHSDTMRLLRCAGFVEGASGCPTPESQDHHRGGATQDLPGNQFGTWIAALAHW